MPEEAQQAPDEVQDTSASESAPEDGIRAEESTETVDYEKRFNDLRPELTKAQQENARLRALEDGLRDPDRAAEVLRQYGYSLGDDDQEDGDEAEEQESFRDPRVDELIQARQQEQEEKILSEVSDHIDSLLKDAKLDVPARFKNAILSEAWLRGGGSKVTKDTTQSVVSEWVEEYKALEKQAGERWRQSKQNAPHVSSVGTGATEEGLPLNATHAQRTERMAERLRLNESD